MPLMASNILPVNSSPTEPAIIHDVQRHDADTLGGQLRLERFPVGGRETRQAIDLLDEQCMNWIAYEKVPRRWGWRTH
jgi:hypothetical protein